MKLWIEDLYIFVYTKRYSAKKINELSIYTGRYSGQFRVGFDISFSLDGEYNLQDFIDGNLD